MGWRGERREAWKMVIIGAGACLLAGKLTMAAAAETETRLFSVRIDGRPAGSYQMEISHPNEHTSTVTGRANVFASYFFIKYRYTYQGTEVWTDGQLARLESKTNDDGKRFEVLAKADGGSLRVRVNGKEYTAKPSVWTTTYWHAPDPKSVNRPVDLLDSDTGKSLQGTLQFVGTQQLTLAGETQNCAYFRVRGDLQVDLWYDGQHRLVKEISVEDGHRIVIELVRVSR
jgi:hypothetical protein